MSEPIPLLDLPRQHAPLAPALLEGVAEIIRSAGFIGGKHVDDFEAAFAAFCEMSAPAVGVNSGTDALALALRALGVGPGDDVVLPTYTFIATAEAVSMLGANVRLCDVHSDTYTAELDHLESAATANTKVVIPVHLYGQAATMAPILQAATDRGWKVLEDCAQAHGARYEGKRVGSIGHLGAFSFYPGKNLGALGDGGAVVGRDTEALEHVRRLANHGRLSKYEHAEAGYNSRLDAIQALALGLKLPHLQGWNDSRARVAKAYTERLRELPGITLPIVGSDRTHVYHLYVVQVDDRARLLESFAQENIGAAIHYPLPLHLQPAYRHLGYAKGDFPVSERVSERCVSLPMFPELDQAQIDRVARVLANHVKAGG